jgi:hypothetical protein
MAKIVRDDRARQGPSGRPVLMVLIGSFVLLGIYMVSLMLWSGSESPDHASQNASRELTTGSTTGSSNANPSDRISPANPHYPVPASPSATGTTPTR